MSRSRITHVLPVFTVTAFAFAVAGCDAQKEVTSDVATLEADQAEQIKERVELKESAPGKGTDGTQGTSVKSNANAGTKDAGRNDGDDGKKNKDEIHNLCADFDSCDACIAGLKSEGDSDGGAKAKCRLAVAGCWATWDKPIRCADEEYDERPS